VAIFQNALKAIEPVPFPLAVEPLATPAATAVHPAVLMTISSGLVNGLRIALTMSMSPAACVGRVTVCVVALLAAHEPTDLFDIAIY
jgi:hypothetical protein